MKTDLKVKLVLELTFGEYCSIITALENEVKRLSAVGATYLSDKARQLLNRVRESYLNGLYYEN